MTVPIYPECNRKACNSKRACWWNTCTNAYYCGGCARRINESAFGTIGEDICIRHFPCESCGKLKSQAALASYDDIPFDQNPSRVSAFCRDCSEHCHQCGEIITGKPLIDEERVRFYCDAACQIDWYLDHDQDQYGNDLDGTK